MRIAEGLKIITEKIRSQGKSSRNLRSLLSVAWDQQQQHNSIHHFNDSHERQLHKLFFSYLTKASAAK